MSQSYLAVSLCSLSAAAFFCASSTYRQPEAGRFMPDMCRKAGASSQEHSIAQIALDRKHAFAKLHMLRCLDKLAISMFIIYVEVDLYSHKAQCSHQAPVVLQNPLKLQLLTLSLFLLLPLLFYQFLFFVLQLLCHLQCKSTLPTLNCQAGSVHACHGCES